MKAEELVGHRIRQRREDLAMSQADFGHRLAHWLGRPWTRQAVSAAEQGKRAFTAAELFAIAHVLDTRIARLCVPPVSAKGLEMPSGATLPTRQTVDIGIADRYLAEMWDDVAHLRVSSEQVHQTAKDFEDKLATVIAASEASTMHPDPDQAREDGQ